MQISIISIYFVAESLEEDSAGKLKNKSVLRPSHAETLAGDLDLTLD